MKQDFFLSLWQICGIFNIMSLHIPSFQSTLLLHSSCRYPFPTVFSTCSKKDLAASLEKGVGMCLYNMPEVKVLYGGQKCGNGYVEEGEECDCGEPEVRSRVKAFILTCFSGVDQSPTLWLCWAALYNYVNVKQCLKKKMCLCDKQKLKLKSISENQF